MEKSFPYNIYRKKHAERLTRTDIFQMCPERKLSPQQHNNCVLSKTLSFGVTYCRPEPLTSHPTHLSVQHMNVSMQAEAVSAKTPSSTHCHQYRLTSHWGNRMSSSSVLVIKIASSPFLSGGGEEFTTPITGRNLRSLMCLQALRLHSNITRVPSSFSGQSRLAHLDHANNVQNYGIKELEKNVMPNLSSNWRKRLIYLFW